MKLRQAKKIMKNVCIYSSMIWIYGAGRVDKANNRMCRYYARGNENFKKALKLIEETLYQAPPAEQELTNTGTSYEEGDKKIRR